MDENIRKQARELMKGFCHVCPKCDGKACAGEVPGMGGLGTGTSFQSNVDALKRIRLKMRCLHNAQHPTLACNILGLSLVMPVIAAPMGGVSFNMSKEVSELDYDEAVICGCKEGGIIACAPDGEGDYIASDACIALRKADGYGIPFIKPWAWETLKQKIDNAAATGCSIIGVDVDAAGLITLALQGKPVSPKSPEELTHITAYVHSLGRKFIIKGIMSLEDAQIAVDCGVDAIVVSNHGGRVLDYTPGTAEVLLGIAKAMQGKIEVLADGGVRDGVDVLKMLALGAKAVLIGRPFGIAAIGGGKAGVVSYIKKLQNQLTSAMTLTGCPNIASIGNQILAD